MPKNTTHCPRPGFEPEPLASESSALTMRPPRLPLFILTYIKFRVESCGVLLKEEAEHNLVTISGTNSTLSYFTRRKYLRQKYLSDIPTDKIVLSCGPKISKRHLKIPSWWLKNKDEKLHFRFVKIFLAATNCTGSAEGAMVPVFLRITHWTKNGLPVSPPGLFPPCYQPLEFTAKFSLSLIGLN